MKLTENQKQAIIDFFNDCNLSISGHDAFYVVENQLEKYDLSEDLGGFAVAVEGELIELVRGDSFIYYADAIEYLQENDPSLQESMALASNYGFETSDLDSVKLADLLFQEIEVEKIQDIDLEEIFDIIKNNQ